MGLGPIRVGGQMGLGLLCHPYNITLKSNQPNIQKKKKHQSYNSTKITTLYILLKFRIKLSQIYLT